MSFLSGGEGGDRPHIAVAECLSANLIKNKKVYWCTGDTHFLNIYTLTHDPNTPRHSVEVYSEFSDVKTKAMQY